MPIHGGIAMSVMDTAVDTVTTTMSTKRPYPEQVIKGVGHGRACLDSPEYRPVCKVSYSLTGVYIRNAASKNVSTVDIGCDHHLWIGRRHHYFVQTETVDCLRNMADPSPVSCSLWSVVFASSAQQLHRRYSYTKELQLPTRSHLTSPLSTTLRVPVTCLTHVQLCHDSFYIWKSDSYIAKQLFSHEPRCVALRPPHW